MSTLPLRGPLVALLAALALLLGGCGGAASTPTRTAPLESLFEAPLQLLAAPSATMALLERLGVDRVRVFVPWGQIAPGRLSPTAPAGFDAASPADYSQGAWAPYDAIVRAGVAHRIGVDFTLAGPPPLWASGPGAPPGKPHPQWEPSAADYGQFVRAAGTRYSGSFVPPGQTRPLPRVSFWSIWNEPNYGPQLAPQAIDDSTVEVSPRLYRGLLDAAWQALRATGHGRDTILIGELAPRGITTGDNPGNFSGMVPLRFLRALYCVDSSLHRLTGETATARGCPTGGSASRFVHDHPALFHATGFAVHPYPQGQVPPNVPTADEPDYADLAALPRVEKMLDQIQSVYGSGTRFPLYSTEFGFQTNPPEKIARAISPSLAAVYLNWSEYITWRDPRLRSWDQYLLEDSVQGNFATGLLFADGTPKPLYFAYRLPVFLPATSGRRNQPLQVWGCLRPARYARTATGGAAQVVSLQFRPRGSRTFNTIRKVTVTDPYGYFDVTQAFSGSGALRLQWSYPHGSTIHSRIVAVTIR